jgi:hypothetical protein
VPPDHRNRLRNRAEAIASALAARRATTESPDERSEDELSFAEHFPEIESPLARWDESVSKLDRAETELGLHVDGDPGLRAIYGWAGAVEYTRGLILKGVSHAARVDATESSSHGVELAEVFGQVYWEVARDYPKVLILNPDNIGNRAAAAKILDAILTSDATARLVRRHFECSLLASQIGPRLDEVIDADEIYGRCFVCDASV